MSSSETADAAAEPTNESLILKIVIIGLPSLIGVIIIIILVYCCCCSKNKEEDEEDENEPNYQNRNNPNNPNKPKNKVKYSHKGIKNLHNIEDYYNNNHNSYSARNMMNANNTYDDSEMHNQNNISFRKQMEKERKMRKLMNSVSHQENSDQQGNSFSTRDNLYYVTPNSNNSNDERGRGFVSNKVSSLKINQQEISKKNSENPKKLNLNYTESSYVEEEFNNEMREIKKMKGGEAVEDFVYGNNYPKSKYPNNINDGDTSGYDPEPDNTTAIHQRMDFRKQFKGRYEEYGYSSNSEYQRSNKNNKNNKRNQSYSPKHERRKDDFSERQPQYKNNNNNRINISEENLSDVAFDPSAVTYSDDEEEKKKRKKEQSSRSIPKEMHYSSNSPKHKSNKDLSSPKHKERSLSPKHKSSKEVPSQSPKNKYHKESSPKNKSRKESSSSPKHHKSHKSNKSKKRMEDD
jgi:hypothetical protein